MLDDRLASLFAEAAGRFDPPDAGPQEILEQARSLRTAQGDAAFTDDDRDGPIGDDTDSDTSGTGTGRAVGGVAGAAAPSRWREGRLRRAGAAAARHRVLTTAACLVVLLVVVGIAGAIGRTTSPPTATSSARVAAPAAAPHAGSPATTTEPAFGTERQASGAPTQASAPQSNATHRLTTTPTSVPVQAAAPFVPAAGSSKIQQTGSLGLTVRPGSLQRALTRLTAIATGAGGFVASSQTQAGSGADGPPSGSITLTVPVSTFAGVVRQAQALGKTTDLSTKATNVTAQYVDLQARIGALEATHQQYLTILAKATTIGDVLSVQEQAASVETQIEQLQGQLNLLDSQTAYSTLAVSLNEPTSPPRPGPTPESGVIRSWHQSVNGFTDGVEGVIRYAGPVLFVLLCAVLLWFGGRTVWRRLQRHNL